MRDSEGATINDFLIVIHNNFLSAMHGFRNYEVLLRAEYEVIVISPLGGVLLTESERATQFHHIDSSIYCRVSLTVSTFFNILFWLVITYSDPLFVGVF